MMNLQANACFVEKLSLCFPSPVFASAAPRRKPIHKCRLQQAARRSPWGIPDRLPHGFCHAVVTIAGRVRKKPALEDCVRN